MPSENNVVALTRLSRELRALAADGRTVPSYARLYRGVLNGEIPAEQDASRRWWIARDALPDIARQLGVAA